MLTVSFKVPIVAVDAVREIIKNVYRECKCKSEPEEWDKLTEDERAVLNRIAHQCELAARNFDIDLGR